MKHPTFRHGSLFFDVHGIPVSKGSCESDWVPACAAWDVSPPRSFDAEWVERYGKAIPEERFREMLTEVFAGV